MPKQLCHLPCDAHSEEDSGKAAAAASSLQSTGTAQQCRLPTETWSSHHGGKQLHSKTGTGWVFTAQTSFKNHLPGSTLLLFLPHGTTRVLPAAEKQLEDAARCAPAGTYQLPGEPS